MADRTSTPAPALTPREQAREEQAINAKVARMVAQTKAAKTALSAQPGFGRAT